MDGMEDERPVGPGGWGVSPRQWRREPPETADETVRPADPPAWSVPSPWMVPERAIPAPAPPPPPAPVRRGPNRLTAALALALVVAMIFCCVLLISITAAHLYGVFFLKAPDPATMAGKVQLATPAFYMQPLVWALAIAAACFAALVTYLSRK